VYNIIIAKSRVSCHRYTNNYAHVKTKLYYLLATIQILFYIPSDNNTAAAVISVTSHLYSNINYKVIIYNSIMHDQFKNELRQLHKS